MHVILGPHLQWRTIGAAIAGFLQTSCSSGCRTKGIKALKGIKGNLYLCDVLPLAVITHGF